MPSTRGAGSKHDITALLLRFRAGDREAESQLVPLVYRQLRRAAAAELRHERDPSLEPTELVHEAFLRITHGRQPEWQSRTHFYAVAARLMRQVLVDHARRRQAQKRGGVGTPLQYESGMGAAKEKSDELIALDKALKVLSKRDERQSRIVEMKFFGGLSIDEIAAVLEISPRTVKREWTMARAWLHKHVRGKWEDEES